ncbi:MAG: DUF2946 family protein [Pseudomonadota bacterium]
MARLSITLRLLVALCIALSGPLGHAAAQAGPDGFSVVLCSGVEARVGPDGSLLPATDGDDLSGHDCLWCGLAKAPPAEPSSLRRPTRGRDARPVARDAAPSAPCRITPPARGPPPGVG